MNKTKVAITTVVLGGASVPLVGVVDDQIKYEALKTELIQEYDARAMAPKRGKLLKDIAENPRFIELDTDETKAKLEASKSIITDGKRAIFYERAAFAAKKNQYAKEVRSALKTKDGEMMADMPTKSLEEAREIIGIADIIVRERGGCTINNYKSEEKDVLDVILNNECS